MVRSSVWCVRRVVQWPSAAGWFGRSRLSVRAGPLWGCWSGASVGLVCPAWGRVAARPCLGRCGFCGVRAAALARPLFGAGCRSVKPPRRPGPVPWLFRSVPACRAWAAAACCAACSAGPSPVWGRACLRARLRGSRAPPVLLARQRKARALRWACGPLAFRVARRGVLFWLVALRFPPPRPPRRWRVGGVALRVPAQPPSQGGCGRRGRPVVAFRPPGLVPVAVFGWLRCRCCCVFWLGWSRARVVRWLSRCAPPEPP